MVSVVLHNTLWYLWFDCWWRSGKDI